MESEENKMERRNPKLVGKWEDNLIIWKLLKLVNLIYEWSSNLHGSCINLG